MHPSKEYLVKSINSLRKRIDFAKSDIQSIMSAIVEEKNVLPNSGIAHERLWTLRRELKYKKNEMHLYKVDMCKLQRQLNELYNEYNIRNHAK